MLHHPFGLLLSIFLGIAALTQLVLSAPTKGVTENTKVLGLKATSFESKARVLYYIHRTNRTNRLPGAGSLNTETRQTPRKSSTPRRKSLLQDMDISPGHQDISKPISSLPCMMIKTGSFSQPFLMESTWRS